MLHVVSALSARTSCYDLFEARRQRQVSGGSGGAAQEKQKNKRHCRTEHFTKGRRHPRQYKGTASTPNARGTRPRNRRQGALEPKARMQMHDQWRLSASFSRPVGGSAVKTCIVMDAISDLGLWRLSRQVRRRLSRQDEHRHGCFKVVAVAQPHGHLITTSSRPGGRGKFQAAAAEPLRKKKEKQKDAAGRNFHKGSAASQAVQRYCFHA